MKQFLHNDYEDDSKLSDADYLRDLSDRLRQIPVVHGVDGYDCDRLRWIAADMDKV